MATKKLVLIRDVFNMLREGGKRETYYRFGDKVFRVVYENSNGTPCGYDYKHCVDVFNATSDEWHHVINRDYIQNIVTKPMDFSNYFCKEPAFKMWSDNFIAGAKIAIAELFNNIQ